MKDVLLRKLSALDLEKGSQNDLYSCIAVGGDCLMIYAMALGRTGDNKQICGRGQKRRFNTTIKMHDLELFDGFAKELLWILECVEPVKGRRNSITYLDISRMYFNRSLTCCHFHLAE